jgi:predicted HicB family RNase H-like nuclease
VDDVDLRSAIHAWLASERGAEPSTDAAQGDEQAVRSTSPADATDSERKPASTHSGRFLVRMPGTLHEQLARAAEREQVSLNRFVTDALATTVSPARGPAADPDAPAGEPDAAPGEPATAPSATQADPQPPPARTIRMILAANVAVVVLATTVAAVLLVLALERGI